MKTLALGTVKSKTIYLGLAVSLMGYLQLHKQELSVFIPGDWIGIGDVILGAAIIVCRFFTSESLTEKGTPANENE